MSIRNRIRNLLFKSDTSSSKDFPFMDDFDFPDSTYVFLIGFSYDTPTKQTFTWIKNILSKSNKQDKILRFHDANFKKTDLIAELDKNFERVEIFCGHGESNGLNGPPYHKINPDFFKDIHSIIYDVEMITTGPSSMFAFCCSAAKKFGRAFASLKDNRFIGFNDEIPFPKELYDDLKYIFQIITKDIIQKGKIENIHEIMFIQEIDKLINNVDKYKNPDKIGIYLLEYRNLFRAYI